MPRYRMTYPYAILRDGKRFEPGDTLSSKTHPGANFEEDTETVSKIAARQATTTTTPKSAPAPESEEASAQ